MLSHIVVGIDSFAEVPVAEPTTRLAWSATIACRLVEALAGGAGAGDGTPAGELIAEVRSFLGDVEPARFTDTRETLDRLRRTGASLAEAALEWTTPLDRALEAGHPLPPLLAALVADVTVETLDPLPRRVFDRATGSTDAGSTDADAEYHRLLGGIAEPTAAGGPRAPRRSLYAVGGVALVLVALLGWLVVRLSGPQTSDLPLTVGQLGPACDGTVYPDAARYASTGPHPATVLITGSLSAPGWTSAVLVRDASDNTIDLPVWMTDKVHAVQTVACFKLDESARTEVKKCAYGDPLHPALSTSPVSVPMYQGEYAVTVAELRTGRELYKGRVSGADTECPLSIWAGTRHVFSVPSTQQYVNTIGRYVDR